MYSNVLVRPGHVTLFVKDSHFTIPTAALETVERGRAEGILFLERSRTRARTPT